MRPKKRILLVDSSDIGRSVLTCVLATRGYAVTAAPSAVAAAGPLAARSFDLAVACLDGASGGAELARDACLRRCGMPVLVFSRKSKNFQLAPYAALFLPKGFTVIELLDAVRIFAARKRGPKKRPPASAPASPAEPAAAEVPA